jgi:hypothetical protein
MAHRIRHAMNNDPEPGKLSGIVEADETFVGGKIRKCLPGAGKGWQARQRSQRMWKAKRVPVAVLVSRDGKARARALDKVSSSNLKAFIQENVDLDRAALHTDEWKGYLQVGGSFAGGHHSVSHRKGEYAKPGGIHSNTAECFNGLFKRSIQGAWHHISREHIQRYLDEQCFRWSSRDVDDGARTLAALDRVGGVRLYYKQPTTPTERGGESLMAGG